MAELWVEFGGLTEWVCEFALNLVMILGSCSASMYCDMLGFL